MKPSLALTAGVLLGLLTFVLVLAGTDTTQAQTFNPQMSACSDDATTLDPDPTTEGDPEECDGDNSPEISTDTTIQFNLPSGDVNFAGVVAFIPGDWGIVPGDEIPIGAVVGELIAQATLGLINGACSNALPVHFIMLNASIDPTDTVPFLDEDDEGTLDYAEDRDDSGLQDGIEKYPDFITRVLDDEEGNPLQPIRRSAGITIVAGVTVLIQFLVFEPGTFINENISHDASLGYPSVTLLQNAGDPDFDPEPSAITDFCTPLLSTNTSFGISRDNPCTDIPGATVDPVCDVTSAPLELVADAPITDPDESGYQLSSNPKDGTYKFTTISVGQRDADGDGIENSLDTCAFEPNVGDPRVSADGDFDTDGLDAACDPDDNETDSDPDRDGYPNRGDNCPLVANGEEDEDVPGVGNQRDTDDDAIGDACDPDPEDEDAQGELIVVEVSSDVIIGTGEGEGGPPSAEACPKCFVTSDGPTTGGDDGGGSGALIIIIVVVVAAVVVIGGGAFFFMRRRPT